jgi:hypothetical protein
MRIVCKCGHKVTVNVPPERHEEWSKYAKRCDCKDCYEKRTGKVCNNDTVMVSELCA